MEWSGWGTALKPAHEPIIVARKPFQGTVAENVLRYGTGALNIETTRVGFAGEADETESKNKNRHADFQSEVRDNRIYGKDTRPRGLNGNWSPPGRWPTNLVLTHGPGCQKIGQRIVDRDLREIDPKPEANGAVYAGRREAGQGFDGGSRAIGTTEEVIDAWQCVEGCPVAELDRQSGISASVPHQIHAEVGPRDDKADFGLGAYSQFVPYEDAGGASRFFPTFGYDVDEVSLAYVPKAARGEREAGLDGQIPAVDPEDGIKPVGLKCRKCDRWKVSGSPCICDEPDFEVVPFDRRKVVNVHPTVKPIALMRWLVRLVTPPGGLVLDPFAGSGTTGCAAVAEGYRFFGVENEARYVAIAQERIAYWEKRPPAELPKTRLIRDEPEALPSVADDF